MPTAFCRRQARVTSQPALRLRSPVTLQLSRLPPPLPLPVGGSSCLPARCQPLCASCCSVPLYSSRSCTVRCKVFSLFSVFDFHVPLCEKYYKPSTVQYHTVDCASWVPRELCWTDGHSGLTNALLEQNSFVYRGLTAYCTQV